MSWSAHQFESYVMQKHFGSKVRISYLAIVLGDVVPDSIVKIWVYGFTIHGHHYGAKDPADFHRSWPGGGFTHSMAFGLLIATVVWWIGRKKPWGVPWFIGIVIGQWAHVLTDINDTKGTMLLFPFSTHNYSLGTWAYGAQVGKHEDAAAYYSSLGFGMDVLWLVILVIYARKVLTRGYFEQVVRPADPAVWARLNRRLSDDSLLAVYRGLFCFAVARLLSWTIWAHWIDGHTWDLSWGGPDWLHKVKPSHQYTSAWVIGVIGVGIACVAFTKLVLDRNRLADINAGPPRAGGPAKVIAHRTSPLDAAENTVAGIAISRELGAEAAEVDVRLTWDGVAVLVHDRVPWRTARWPLPVWLSTYGQLAAAHARRGLELTTLRQALEASPDVELALDVKTSAAMPVTLDEVLASGRRNVQLWARDQASVALARIRAPWATTALLRNTRTRRRTFAYIRDAAAAGAQAVSLHQRAVTHEVVEEAHRRGLLAYAWVVAEPAHQVTMEPSLDGVVTDWPALARSIVGGAGDVTSPAL